MAKTEGSQTSQDQKKPKTKEVVVAYKYRAKITRFMDGRRVFEGQQLVLNDPIEKKYESSFDLLEEVKRTVADEDEE